MPTDLSLVENMLLELQKTIRVFTQKNEEAHVAIREDLSEIKERISIIESLPNPHKYQKDICPNTKAINGLKEKMNKKEMRQIQNERLSKSGRVAIAIAVVAILGSVITTILNIAYG